MPPLQLSKDQNSAFTDITDWYVYHQNSVPFLTMGGYAGTGKTTLMSLLQDKLNNSTIAYCAYTGKAASVLRKKLNEHNQDIEITGCSQAFGVMSLLVGDAVGCDTKIVDIIW